MTTQKNEIKQFRILGSDVLNCKYEPNNKGKEYFTFKPLIGASNKKKFSKLSFKPRPRWPLDDKAVFVKGKGTR